MFSSCSYCSNETTELNFECLHNFCHACIFYSSLSDNTCPICNEEKKKIRVNVKTDNFINYYTKNKYYDDCSDTAETSLITKIYRSWIWIKCCFGNCYRNYIYHDQD